MAWYDPLIDVGGKALDWLSDNDWLVDTITRLSYDNPELDYDKLMEMAVQEAVINSPDVFTPQGRTTTDVDPETGKRTVRQEYTPEIQGLYEMLVRNAGADINPYQAPEGMTGQMLGKYINDRETHMGLPLSDYQRPSFQREGVRAPVGNYWDEEDEESDPSKRPEHLPDDIINQLENIPNFEDWWGGMNEQEQRDRMNEIQDMLRTNQNFDLNKWYRGQQEFSLDDMVNDFTTNYEWNPIDDPAMLDALENDLKNLERGEFVSKWAGKLGSAVGIPGAGGVGSIASWMFDQAQDSAWGNLAFQSPAPGNTDIDDINENLGLGDTESLPRSEMDDDWGYNGRDLPSDTGRYHNMWGGWSGSRIDPSNILPPGTVSSSSGGGTTLEDLRAAILAMMPK